MKNFDKKLLAIFILLGIIICISIYAVYMVMTKDPLVKMLLGKIGIKW